MYVPSSSAASHAGVTSTQPLSPPPTAKVMDKLVAAGPALALTPQDRVKAGRYAQVDFDPSAFQFETAAPYAKGGKGLLEDHKDLIPSSFQRVGDTIFVHAEGLPHPIKTSVQEINTALQTLLKEKNPAIAGNFALSLLLFDGAERVQLPKEATAAILNRFRTQLEEGAHPLGALVEGQWQLSCAAYVENYTGNGQGLLADFSRVDALAKDPGMTHATRQTDLDKLGKDVIRSQRQARQSGDYHVAFDAMMAFEAQVFRGPADPLDFEDKIIIPNPQKESEESVNLSGFTTPAGLKQSVHLSNTALLPGKIEDGFIFTPFYSKLDEHGDLTYSTQTKVGTNRYFQETLVVDRRRDPGLAVHMEEAQKILASVDSGGGTQEQKAAKLCVELMKYIDRAMGGRQPNMDWERSLDQKPVYLGNVPPGGGVCRHRALLFSVLAGDLGLDVAIRSGIVKTPSNEGHTWNEVRIGTKTFIADPMIFPNQLLDVTTDLNAKRYNNLEESTGILTPTYGK